MPTYPEDTTPELLEEILAAAESAAGPYGDLTPAERARALVAVADALTAAASELVPLAMAESSLPEARLSGEIKRTAVQLRMFAEVLTDGSYLDVVLDEADPDFALGPRPALRRMKFPLGPVVVYAASNFPFAFSVAGGDTASALAAGCPVVLKAHPGHPRLSARTGEIVADALRGAGAPDGVFAVIFGMDAGVSALRDERVEAAAFTGSVAGGRALSDIAAARPKPIPFYGELGAINPVFVTPTAVAARGEQIAAGFVASYTLGVGQFCTNPGLLFLPSGHDLEDTLRRTSAGVSAGRMLTEKVYDGFGARAAEILGTDGVRVIHKGEADDAEQAVGPTLVTTDVATSLKHRDVLLPEAFGPLSIVVTYDDVAALPDVAAQLEGSLTAGVHLEPSDVDDVRPLVRQLVRKAGRVLFNEWPTGVAVTPAMQHGGPYPATTAPLHTSVGARSIDRFLRPVVFQNAPAALLPAALTDENPLTIPRTTSPAGESTTWGDRA